MKGRHFIAITIVAVVLAAMVAFLSDRDRPNGTFTAGVEVRQQGKTIGFSLSLRNASGRKISPGQLPGGAPRPPKVKVFDDQGKQVYVCTLEYG